MRLVTKAVAYARNWHNGQLYGDETYFDGHLVKVANVVVGLGGTDKHVAIAYLHDILEDTELQYAELVYSFGAGIASTVHTLTKRDGESYSSYMSRVMADPDARIVKLADSMVNLAKTTSELFEGSSSPKTSTRIILYSNNIATLSRSLW